MEQNNYCLTLTHHGIKGMKWGIRRTAAQLGHKVFKKKQKPQAEGSNQKQAAKPASKKTMREMTDAELRAAIERARLEQTYAQLRPQTATKGSKFISTIMDRVVVPAATEAGKNLMRDKLTQVGKKYLGLEDTDAAESAFKKLKKQAEESIAKTTIRENARKHAKWDAEDAAAAEKAKPADNPETTKTATSDRLKGKKFKMKKSSVSAETADTGKDFVSEVVSENTPISGKTAFISKGREYIDPTDLVNK